MFAVRLYFQFCSQYLKINKIKVYGTIYIKQFWICWLIQLLLLLFMINLRSMIFYSFWSQGIWCARIFESSVSRETFVYKKSILLEIRKTNFPFLLPRSPWVFIFWHHKLVKPNVDVSLGNWSRRRVRSPPQSKQDCIEKLTSPSSDSHSNG